MGFAEVFVTVLIEQKPVCALIFPASEGWSPDQRWFLLWGEVASSVFHWRGAHVHSGGACWVGGIPVGWGPAGPWGVAEGLPSPRVGPGDVVVSSSSAWGQWRQLLKAGSCLSNDNSLVQRMPFFLCPSPGEDSICGCSCLPVWLDQKHWKLRMKCHRCFKKLFPSGIFFLFILTYFLIEG